MTPIERAAQNMLEAEFKRAGAVLRAITGVGSGQMGLTPGIIKFSPEYRAAKAATDTAFSALRAFNAKHA